MATEQRQHIEDQFALTDPFLLSWHVSEVGIRRAPLIADDLGLRWQRNLSIVELAEMARADGAERIPSNERRSFMEADLVIEARDSEGLPCYVAVEISFTVNGRDTRRAMRNARILAELTGVAAHPVIVGNRLDDRVRSEVESGSVAWHPLPDDSLEAR